MSGVVVALLLLVLPGLVVGRLAGLSWPVATVVGPALTYGVVAVAIVPFGAVRIPWNVATAVLSLAVIGALAAGLRRLLARYRNTDAAAGVVAPGPVLVLAAAVLLGAVLIGCAAVSGIPHWQSIPSTWDSVWHANTVRFILDTGQASPTHMGELRNVETHAVLYYPSAFHALAALLCQLTGAASTSACTLSALAAAIWLFPVSAAVLAWRMLRPAWTQWRSAGAAATAGCPDTAARKLAFSSAGTSSVLLVFGAVRPRL